MAANATITARQFRAILFAIDQQRMTIGELRQKLDLVEDQDAPVALDVNALTNLLGGETVYRFGQKRVA